MSALLARTANRLYWGARYAERAEDLARIVRAYNNLVVDYASDEPWRWEPLAAVTGGDAIIELPDDDQTGERTVMYHLLADRENPSSILSSIQIARENLRTTREVMPREAWQTINALWQYTNATASSAVGRQLRDRFLGHVVDSSRQLDGVIESTMSHTDAYRLMRLGRLVERADMTTRVLGVAAVGILAVEQHAAEDQVNEEVLWMSVLRSVSAMQMYQRTVRGPIDGMAVVGFLLNDAYFPRSVASCLGEIRVVVGNLPNHDPIIEAIDFTAKNLARSLPGEVEGETLDRTTDRLQSNLENINRTIATTYFL